MFYGGDGDIMNRVKEFVILCLVVMVLCLVTIATNIVQVQSLKRDLKTQNRKEISKIIICGGQIIEAEINSQIKHLNKFQLLLSIMYVESRYSSEAIGDNGSSFGLFQVKQIFYKHHKLGGDFETYITDDFHQVECHLSLLEKYKNLTILEFAKTVQKPKFPNDWTNKVVLKYNSF